MARVGFWEAWLRCPKVLVIGSQAGLGYRCPEKRSQALRGRNLARDIRASDAPKRAGASGGTGCQRPFSTLLWTLEPCLKKSESSSTCPRRWHWGSLVTLIPACSRRSSSRELRAAWHIMGVRTSGGLITKGSGSAPRAKRTIGWRGSPERTNDEPTPAARAGQPPERQPLRAEGYSRYGSPFFQTT
jgi:hypothetical protein